MKIVNIRSDDHQHIFKQLTYFYMVRDYPESSICLPSVASSSVVPFIEDGQRRMVIPEITLWRDYPESKKSHSWISDKFIITQLVRHSWSIDVSDGGRSPFGSAQGGQRTQSRSLIR